MLRKLEFYDVHNKLIFETKRPVSTMWKTVSREQILEAGERIVGVKGNTSYEWWGAKGFWKNIEFLVAN